MSVYKDPRSPNWAFDFQLRGHRFHGSTKATNRRDAKKVEDAEREKAKQHVAAAIAAKTSLRLDDIAGWYWQEVGQHHEGADNTWRQINFLLEFFGKDKLITDVTDDDVTKLVAWRRGHKTCSGALISPFTVNDTTEQLKKLFTRAKDWNVRFERAPQWKRHWLKEPQERVRELSKTEDALLFNAMRDDYEPFFAYAQASGARLRECLLQWSEVDWDNKLIRRSGRAASWPRCRSRPPSTPFSGHCADIIPSMSSPTGAADSRWTSARRSGLPITLQGVKTQWRRLRKRAGVDDFRFHDFRHDFGTKMLRATGNLKLVQRALNHADLKTTTRYAHVLDQEVARRWSASKNPEISPEASCGRWSKAIMVSTVSLAARRPRLGDWGSRVQISPLRPSKSNT